MLISAIQDTTGIYRSSKAISGFMILEEDIAEEDENIVTNWYLNYYFYTMKKGVLKLNFYMACFR